MTYRTRPAQPPTTGTVVPAGSFLVPVKPVDTLVIALMQAGLPAQYSRYIHHVSVNSLSFAHVVTYQPLGQNVVIDPQTGSPLLIDHFIQL